MNTLGIPSAVDHFEAIITVLGTIALTAYKETSQQIINLPQELSIKRSDLLNCKISPQVYVLISVASELLISQFAILYDNQQETSLWYHVSYRPTLEAVDGRKEIETSVIVLIFSSARYHS